MANQRIHPSPTTADLVADYLEHRDEEVMQALVAAGALVALADGQLEQLLGNIGDEIWKDAG
jgi:tellurite resistance protein